jgi:hypothetical protein
MKTNNALLDYLESQFKEGLSYADAILLIKGIYVYADILPSSVSTDNLTRDGLSYSFACFATKGGIRANGLTCSELEAITKNDHWLAIINEVYLTKESSFDIAKLKGLIINGGSG